MPWRSTRVLVVVGVSVTALVARAAAETPLLTGPSPVLTASSDAQTVTVSGTFPTPLSVCLTNPDGTRIDTSLTLLTANSITIKAVFATAGTWHLQVTSRSRKSNVLVVTVQAPPGRLDRSTPARPTSARSTSARRRLSVPPLTLTCPADQVVVSPTGSGVSVAFRLTATGGTLPIKMTSSPESGSLLPLGVTTVHGGASDSGTPPQTASCSFTVTVSR
jgi:hypothetical protein